MKELLGTFNQEKVLVGAFSVITNLRMDLFEALVENWYCSGVFTRWRQRGKTQQSYISAVSGTAEI